MTLRTFLSNRFVHLRKIGPYRKIKTGVSLFGPLCR